MQTTTDTRSSFARFATQGERGAARRLVQAALNRGMTVDVNDGEETTLRGSTSSTAILGALCTTGEDTIIVRQEVDGRWIRSGSFYLVWGNAEDGSELIADHSDNPTAEELYNATYPEA